MQKAHSKKHLVIGGAALITANMLANVLNFIFNIYLGRQLSLQLFGEISLFTSLLYLTSVPLGCFSATISHNIAYLYGKYSKGHARKYLDHMWNRSIAAGLIFTAGWALLSPFLTVFFKTQSPYLMMFFAPLWVISVASANYSGYLKGTLAFGKIAILAVVEALVRLLCAMALFALGLQQYIALAILCSFTATMIAGAVLTGKTSRIILEKKDRLFNTFFFFTSSLNGISVITFLTLDIALVKHFMTPIEAGQYGLLSLVGKMTYFVGSLFAPFMIPLVSHNLGAKKDNRATFFLLFLLTFVFCLGSFVGLGLMGSYVVPFVFGAKTQAIVPLLVPYVLAMAIFTTSQPIVSYFQAKEKYSYAMVGAVVAVLQVVLTTLFHENLSQIVWIMLAMSIVNFALMAVMYLLKKNPYEKK